MVFPIAGGTQDTGYEISNSLRFNNGDSPKLSFDPSGAGNVDTMTLSFWMKVGVSDFGGQHNNILSVRPESGTYTMLVLRTSGKLMFEKNGEGTLLRTNRLFRDPSAWYHIVLALDSTNGTAANRVRLYVNGEEETDFEVDDRSSLSQNTDFLWGGGQPHQISGDPSSSAAYWLGDYLAEMHMVNGSQLTPSSFGETNDNGFWIPKKYTGSYGTNGFYLEFKQTGTSANSSGIGADTSGNDNHFTPTNLAATDVTTDTPTNNFCTLNALDNDGVVLSEGNCNFDTSSGNNEGVRGTIGVQNGKWYYECKITGSAGMSAGNIGYSRPEVPVTSGPASVLGLFANGSSTFGLYNNSSGKTSLDASAGIGQNDIIGVALDLDSSTKTIAYYRNGSIMGSAQTINASILGDFLLPVMLDDGGVNDVVGSFNFGNPTFSISSGNADANGYGNFEYAPPSGYYSLCTKNLAEFG